MRLYNLYYYYFYYYEGGEMTGANLANGLLRLINMFRYLVSRRPADGVFIQYIAISRMIKPQYVSGIFTGALLLMSLVE